MSQEAAVRMDRMYRYQRHIYDMTRRHYLLGRKTLINGLLPPLGGTVLEIGCGTGWNLVRVAAANPDARIYGFDISKEMLATAKRAVARAGYQDRVVLVQADATSFQGAAIFQLRSFDRVFTSYALSMIPNWRLALQCAFDHVAPGGSLHIVDFGSAAALPHFARVALHAWLEQFDVEPRLDLRADAGRLAVRSSADVFHMEMYRGYAQYAVITRR
jgi:S-adenosylmethionine-diacylgycerolhomoserine-N-methlytransferase